MASRGSEPATQRVAELEEELRGLAEQLSRCQADKEFVWSLWKHLQVSKPDLTQAVSLVVEREKLKAEVKDRRILEILQAKDIKIESLEQCQTVFVVSRQKSVDAMGIDEFLMGVLPSEICQNNLMYKVALSVNQRLTEQQQEINCLMQRKSAVDEENARLKNEFSNLNRKFKDKSQELKDTEECAQKKKEQNRLVIKNLEEESKGLNICCADLLRDLEKLRKQEAQWKKEKSGNDTRIKNLETDLAETREQIKSLHSICSNLLSHVHVKQEELLEKYCGKVRAKIISTQEQLFALVFVELHEIPPAFVRSVKVPFNGKPDICCAIPLFCVISKVAMVHSVPLSGSLMKMLKSGSPDVSP
ncbi:centlein-like protein [Turdus rufiventris]|nr:centlein-like protein [Turdus rufiventris]